MKINKEIWKISRGQKKIGWVNNICKMKMQHINFTNENMNKKNISNTF